MKTLVIIDDEQEMESLYEIMLETAIDKGLIKLLFFSDARDFIEWFKNNTPDLILCDLNMPYVSGVEIGKFIRETRPSTPLYFVSGYEAEDYQEIMNDLGVTHFLSKPLDYDVVLNSINTELGL